jgi:8-oxo-dGTP pyrophosphatase MutT (NUDIX family)
MDVATLRSVLEARLDSNPAPRPGPGDRLAAVLLPILVGPEASVVFTRRTDTLSRHPGEISFPGGLAHAEDGTLLDTAMRETEEELGLPRDRWEILGALPPVHTFVSGILIVPFVGMLPPPPAFHPNPHEIAEVLWFSLAGLAHAEREVEDLRGDDVYRGFAYEMPGATIWGATARILHSLIEIRGGGAE